MLCVPLAEGYDCEWNVEFVLWQDTMKWIWQQNEINKDLPYNELILGITSTDIKTIYLWIGHERDSVIIGCNVFQHEVRHAWGQEHEQMPLTSKYCP